LAVAATLATMVPRTFAQEADASGPPVSSGSFIAPPGLDLDEWDGSLGTGALGEWTSRPPKVVFDDSGQVVMIVLGVYFAVLGTTVLLLTTARPSHSSDY